MIKVNYQKKWDNYGTCYSQTITATRKDFCKIVSYLHQKYNEVQEDNNKYNFYTKYYMKNLANTDKKQTSKYTDYYLNLTQLSFIKELLNNKRILQKNTILRFLYI